MKWKRILNEEIEDGVEMFNSRYDEWDDWYADDNYYWDNVRDPDVDYRYLDEPTDLSRWSRRNRRPDLRQIDMNSIYNKQTFRKKQIERVLGIEKNTIHTLGDLYECSTGT
jgi:hypothetical protein